MMQLSLHQQQEDVGERRMEQRWAAHAPAARDYSSVGRGADEQLSWPAQKDFFQKTSRLSGRHKIWPAVKCPAAVTIC
jgi:hypothetical protein